MSEKEMRVNGVVATTRGLGNHGDVVLKKSVIVEPHTMSVAVDQYCQFLLLASHGVWEVFSETEATNLLLKVHVTIISHVFHSTLLQYHLTVLESWIDLDLDQSLLFSVTTKQFYPSTQ